MDKRFPLTMFCSVIAAEATYGPYHFTVLHPPREKCPAGGWSKSRCRRDFGDCKPGYTCIPALSIFRAPGLPSGMIGLNIFYSEKNIVQV